MQHPSLSDEEIDFGLMDTSDDPPAPADPEWDLHALIDGLPPLELTEHDFLQSFEANLLPAGQGKPVAVPGLSGTVNMQLAQLQWDRYNRVVNDEDDGAFAAPAPPSAVAAASAESAGRVTPVYIIRGKRWVNTRDFFDEWNSKARSAKKAFHNFVRNHRLCSGSDQQVYMLLTSEDDPYGAWPYVKYQNASQVMLLAQTVAGQIVDEFNAATHYSCPPVHRADKGPVKVVDVEALNKDEGKSAKKVKTGAKKAAKKRALDEVVAETDRDVVLHSVTPQVGPANTPATVVLMGQHFVQACPVKVACRAANGAEVIAPIIALENSMLSCALPPLPPCSLQLLVTLARPFSGEIVSSTPVVYHVVDMPPHVAALFATTNSPGGNGGSYNGNSSGNISGGGGGGPVGGPRQGGSAGSGGSPPSWNTGPGGFTSLHMAAAYGKLSDVERVLLRLRRNRRMGRTTCDMRRNYLRLVQWPDWRGRSAVHWALLRASSTASQRWVRTLVHYLAWCGSDLAAATQGGVTPLHLVAARSGDVDLIRIMLNWKLRLDDGRVAAVDVNAADVLGQTPLHYALKKRKPSLTTVTALVHGGADPLWRSPLYDVAPIELARDPEIRSFFERWLSDLKAALTTTAQCTASKRAAAARLAASVALQPPAPKAPPAAAAGKPIKSPRTPSPLPPSKVKVVLVGDGATGKTCWGCVVTGGKFPEEYIPTVFDNMTLDVTVSGHAVRVELWDTAGQEEYSRLRALSYPETDVFLLCFSLASKSSFENIRTKWVPEVRHHQPAGALVLVGMKADLPAREVTRDEATALAKSIDASQYVECSSLSGTSAAAVLDAAVMAAMPTPSTTSAAPTPKRFGCAML